MSFLKSSIFSTLLLGSLLSVPCLGVPETVAINKKMEEPSSTPPALPTKSDTIKLATGVIHSSPKGIYYVADKTSGSVQLLFPWMESLLPVFVISGQRASFRVSGLEDKPVALLITKDDQILLITDRGTHLGSYTEVTGPDQVALSFDAQHATVIRALSANDECSCGDRAVGFCEGAPHCKECKAERTTGKIPNVTASGLKPRRDRLAQNAEAED